MRIPGRFAANVAWLFTDLPWPDRFAAARAAGFGTVEFPWPEDPAGTAEAVAGAGVRVAMLNMPAGNLATGERGWPNDPARTDEWRAAFTQALGLAGSVSCPVINVLAGNLVDGVTRDRQWTCLQDNLKWALPIARQAGVTLVTELLNRQENPRYLLTTLDDAELMLERLGRLGWRLQLDTYHLGRTESGVAAALRRAGPWVGHLQVADLPGRHEPGTGIIDWRAVGGALRDIGYEGAIGLEYAPSAGTAESLDWIERIGLVRTG